MFRRKVSIKKYFVITSVFILLSLFACVVHITPQSHHVADSHTEHGANPVICVDHQGSASLLNKEQSEIIQVAILPQISIEFIDVSNIDFAYSNGVELYPSPNRTPIYIKNNTFLI